MDQSSAYFSKDKVDPARLLEWNESLEFLKYQVAVELGKRPVDPERPTNMQTMLLHAGKLIRLHLADTQNFPWTDVDGLIFEPQHHSAAQEYLNSHSGQFPEGAFTTVPIARELRSYPG